MWSRRVLRAGWALAPVLQFPAKVLKFMFGTKDAAITTLCLFGCAAGIGACTNRQMYLDRVATGAEIEAALKGNNCMIDLMPRRQAIDKKGAPLTNRDLMIGQIDCDEHWKAVGQLQEQKAVLKRLGAK